jgi:RNAse (barnase) inhibitor barstar
MKNFTLKTNTRNILKTAVCTLLLLPTISFSQQYRTAIAYIDDFGKNELFVKKSLIDYSETIIEDHLQSRSQVTSGRIIEKLKRINLILAKNDKGFEKNTKLRDSFLKLNNYTIDCLTNGSLILNDYETQTALPLEKILVNLNLKETSLRNYFEELKNFEKIKKEFGNTYNVYINTMEEKNLFEYNAYQNFLFYKVNILDRKLLTYIYNKDEKGFYNCLKTIKETNKEVISKTNQLSNLYADKSLNNANIEYSKFIYVENINLIPLFDDFILASNNKSNSRDMNLDTKNNYSTIYNLKKDNLFDVLEKIQEKKKVLYYRWFNINSKFLKNNMQFDNIYEAYTTND